VAFLEGFSRSFGFAAIKKRYRIYVLLAMVLFAGLLTCFVVLRYPANVPESTTANDPEGKTGSITRSPPITVSGSLERSSIPIDDPAKQAIVEAQNVPITFWGKVVDQDGQPLAGVRVLMEAREWHSPAPTQVTPHFTNIERNTGADGQFNVIGAKGDILTIKSVAKEGYTTSPKALRSFGYNISQNHPVDADNPVVIRLWKVGNPEPLVLTEKSSRIPYDGTPTTFDLLRGQMMQGLNGPGDLRITLIRSPLKISRGDRFDWKATIEAIDGGVILSNDELMHYAPEVGYNAKIEIDMPTSSLNWTSRQRLSFYIKSRGGQCYGRVSIVLDTDSPRETTGMLITSAINPSGSRNLEPGGQQLSPASH
jgi:hypothetical protein